MSEERAEYRAQGTIEIRLETRLPFADARYVSPSTDEIREVVRRLGLTSAQAADRVGVSSHRKMREYLGGQRDLSYAAWRLLLIGAGLALEPGPEELQRKVADQG